nr:15674_t:CDS:2 [Entrophospora candida]
MLITSFFAIVVAIKTRGGWVSVYHNNGGYHHFTSSLRPPLQEKNDHRENAQELEEKVKYLENEIVKLKKKLKKTGKRSYNTNAVGKHKAEEEHVDGIERGKKLSTAPSRLGKASDYIHVQKHKLLYNGYPQSLQPPPLVLYHPVFANFIDDCKTIELEFDSHIIGERRDKFRELINSYLGFTLNLGSISTNGITYSTDGCIFHEDNIPVILEVKNDNEGNAFKQACGYYWKWIEGLNENYSRITCLPCLIICLTASHLRIAGAFYNGNYLIEGLTENSLDCFESTEPERTQ